MLFVAVGVLNGHQTWCELLASILNLKPVMCLMEKIYMLGKFHSDMSYSAVGCEFDANVSTVYILKKMSFNGNKHFLKIYMFN